MLQRNQCALLFVNLFMATVLITGGTGTIGRALTTELLAGGHNVIVLTRTPKPPARGVVYKVWDPQRGSIDESAIAEADAVVNLAGAGVADKRWTEKRKQEIVQSRVQSGALLVKAMKTIPNKITTVVSASAIGWYGPDPQVPNPRPFVETDAPDNSFLGRTCQQWEEAIRPVEALGKRLVLFRIGIVLSRDGGAYAEFRKPLTFGIASVLGSGKQMVSWIHIDDLVQLFVKAITDEKLRGTYNAVAPHPVSNKELILSLAKAKGGLSIPAPVPEFALKLGLGEMSVEVLKSATVSAEKIESAGFRFQYSTIDEATKALEGGGKF